MLIDEEKGSDKKKHVDKVKEEARDAQKRLRRRNVLVADNESAGEDLGVKVDKEWNTSGWTDEMICDGVKTLFEIFYDSHKSTTNAKALACTMLVKLIGRHAAAEDYVKENIGQLAALAANRFVRGGKSAGILDLLHIVQACKDKFVPQLSDCMVVQRIIYMMNLEIYLAAILIQHVFRRWIHPIRRARRLAAGTVLPVSLEFGSEEEVLAQQQEAINTRTAELKARWDTMHIWQHALQRTICIGYRGPVHLGLPFSHTCLDIVRYLVQDNIPRGLANANRGDVINNNGCVLLCQLIGCTVGPMATAAASILSNAAKVPESFVHIVGSGCVRSCVKYVQMLLDQSRIDFLFRAVPDRSLDNLSKSDRESHPNYVAKISFYDCLNTLAHTAVHAAGMFRAKGGYNYMKMCNILQEPVDYLIYYNLTPNQLAAKPIEECLGHPKLLELLFGLLRRSLQLNCVQTCLRVISALACSDAYRRVLEEVCLEGGMNLVRMIELLEETDPTVHCLIVTLFLQLNTQAPGRHKFIFINIPKYLSAAIQIPKGSKSYNDGYYNRAMLVAASCLRQQEWRAYEPTVFPLHLSQPANIRQSIYLDLLKTIKAYPGAVGSEKMHISDLVILPVDWQAAHDFSLVAESLCARELCAWLTHPEEIDYFSTLPWDESAAGCVIMDALTCNNGTLENIFSVRMTIYLGSCLQLSRHMFSKRTLTDGQTLVILSGVCSACRSLARVCAFVKDNHECEEVIRGIRKSDLLGAAHFYIKTLSTNHPSADVDMVTLQVNTGLAVLAFYTEYVRMIKNMDGHVDDAKRRDLLDELTDAGKSACALVSTTTKVFGDSSRTTKVLTALCDFLVALLRNDGRLTDKAITQWELFKSMRENLPLPLSGIGDDGISEPRYREGLGRLPASFFDLASALCVGDAGKLLALNEGFLRRALENIVLLMPHREKGKDAHKKAAGPTVLTHCISQRSVNTHPIEQAKQEIADNIEDAVFYARKIAACMTLVAELGTFSSMAAGSANDLILHPNYAIVKNCQLVLDDGMYGKGHAIVTAALRVLGNLARDCHRVCGGGCVFEKYDILGTIRYYLHYAAELEEKAISDAVHAVRNIVPVNTDYVTKRLKEIVLPLTRVNRLRPSFNQVILDTTWAVALRLNSFDTGEGDSKDRHKRRIVNAVHEHEDFSDRSVFTGDMKKALEDDSILKKQLEKIYHEAGIDPLVKPEGYQSKKKINASSLVRMFTKSSLASPPAGTAAVGNEKEWHNPTFEQAKEMSSPQEVQHRNFVTDILAKEAGIESVSVPRSSPHTLDAFRKSSYGKQLANEHNRTREGEGLHVNYALTLPKAEKGEAAWSAKREAPSSVQSSPAKSPSSSKLPLVHSPSPLPSPASTSSEYTIQTSSTLSSPSKMSPMGSPSKSQQSPMSLQALTVSSNADWTEWDASPPKMSLKENSSPAKSVLSPSEWLEDLHQQQLKAAGTATASPSSSPHKSAATSPGIAAKGRGKKGYLGLDLDTKYIEKELAEQLKSPSPAKSVGSKGSSKKRKGKKVASPMVVNVQDNPEFLESRPPVFQIKDDDAFIC
eukprot:GSChrysophyteH1.ASY1.ANO1.1853.1 assembled CDS